MVGYIVAFLLGMLAMRYIENKEFKAKIHNSIKGWFKGLK